MSTPVDAVHVVTTLPAPSRFDAWRRRRAAVKAARQPRTARAAVRAAEAVAASPAGQATRKAGALVLGLLAVCAGALLTLAALGVSRRLGST
jgi:hypothetical protein